MEEGKRLLSSRDRLHPIFNRFTLVHFDFFVIHDNADTHKTLVFGPALLLFPFWLFPAFRRTPITQEN